MFIHHATTKRAATLGIILTDEGDTALALHAERNVRIENEDPKFAVALCALAAKLKVEYPAITISDDGEVEFDDLPADIELEPDFNEADAYADIIDAYAAHEESIAEAGEAEEAVEEDEEEGKGSVVPQKYRVEYAARGNADNCGDWLAQYLDGKFTQMVPNSKKPLFDRAAYIDFLYLNDVEITGKWAQTNNNGLFRMSGRNRLEVMVAFNGVVRDLNGIVIPDALWLDMVRDKHAKKLEKIAKQREAAKK